MVKITEATLFGVRKIINFALKRIVIRNCHIQVPENHVNKNCAHLPLFAGAIFSSPWLEVEKDLVWSQQPRSQDF